MLKLSEHNDTGTRIYDSFYVSKFKLLRLLLESYINFSYDKIKELYLAYIDFYHEPFASFRGSLVDNYIWLRKVILNSGDSYFVYLSCILPDEIKLNHFESTRMLISYMSQKSDEFLYLPKK